MWSARGRLPQAPDGPVLPRSYRPQRWAAIWSSESGGGGGKVVYAAYDPELGRKMAIKLVRPASLGAMHPSQRRARMLPENGALRTHPKIVAIHDVGTFGHQVFIAME